MNAQTAEHFHATSSSRGARLADAARALVPAIVDAADDIEANGLVPVALIERLHDAGMFRAVTPREFGGDEVPLLAWYDAIEALAGADASVAWVALIISANPLLLGTALKREVWEATYGRNPDLRTAGHIGPNGHAQPVPGGYRVSGRWKYGSGSEHCEYLLSGAMVFDGDAPRLNSHGEPEPIWFLHPLADCEIIAGSWDTTGLRGSGSHDYVMDDVFVPADWTLRLGERQCPLANPVYGFPTIAFAQLAAITLAMARRALDIVTAMAATKRRGPMLMREDPTLQITVAECDARHQAARLLVRDLVSSIEATLARGDALPPELRGRFRMAVTHAIDTATDIVDAMYKQAGGGAIYRGNPLERLFRDVHTAQTHIQANDLTRVKAGRMLLDMDPGDPLF